MIFAAKTTLSALIALLVAFTFNLDEPKWALLTVFIVAQPQSGLVLAKSFYRIIGTLIGAVVALLFVALFAQERVLFLGALALWVGLCTFGSQYARNFVAYSFVLSGYTVAIVGIPGALDPGSAFYIATARVTEIMLGIIVTATISHIVLPSSLASSLWKAITDASIGLREYVLAVLGKGDVGLAQTKLLRQAIAVENMRTSVIFEDREVRNRSNSLRLLNVALINVVAAGQPLGEQLKILLEGGQPSDAMIRDALAATIVAVRVWRAGGIGAARLRLRLLQAQLRSQLCRQPCRHPSASNEAMIRHLAAMWRLNSLLATLTMYIDAYEACFSRESQRPHPIGFTHSTDPIAALWSGLRAALAIVVASSFWILSNWPHGSTAVILAAVATARLATMGPAVRISVAATLIFSLATIPAFIVIETLLPLASGFEMFSLIVAPVVFCCALLMAYKKTLLIGFLSGLLFASVGVFQDRMSYDPVDLLNTSIAVVFATSVALVMWSVLAPETPEAARHRFLRVAHRVQARITGPRQSISLADFETAMTEALDQLQSHLRPDSPNDVAAFGLATALLGAGREQIRLRDSAPDSFGITADQEADLLECGQTLRSVEPRQGVHCDAA
jgi:uncharacterized membrane protein YccC